MMKLICGLILFAGVAWGQCGVMVVNVANGAPFMDCTGPASSGAAFSALTSGTNTTAAMIVGTGASLTVSGSGTINATSLGGDAAALFAKLASPTFTGTVTIPTPFTLGAVSVTSNGTQLNYLNAATGTTGTTSTNLVFSTSPTLVTPTLGVATATSLNKVTVTAPASSATLTLADGSSLITTGAFASTFTFTGTTGVTFPTSGTLATTTDANFVKGAAAIPATAGVIPFGSGVAGTLTSDSTKLRYVDSFQFLQVGSSSGSGYLDAYVLELFTNGGVAGRAACCDTRAMLLGNDATGLDIAGNWGIKWSSSSAGAGDVTGGNDVSLWRSAPGILAVGNNNTPGNTDGSLKAAGYMASGGTKFTISGCSAGTTVGGATAGTFVSGTTGTCTVVITMNGATGLTAPTGWSCGVSNRTTANLIRQTASSTTTCTVAGTTVTNDVISFFAMAY